MFKNKTSAITIFRNGLATGLVIQLAIGPMFIFIMNLTLQKTIFDGLAGALAVTLVDYFYITLSILGIGSFLQNKKFKKVFGVISSTVLALFGALILRNVLSVHEIQSMGVHESNLLLSFTSVFFMTIVSPMTIVFFTSLFTAKAMEYSYTKDQLVLFGLGTGLGTFLFTCIGVLVTSFFRGSIPLVLIQVLNAVVGCLLIGYGVIRLGKVLRSR